MTVPLPNSANRLALGLMSARDLSYDEAVSTLENLVLLLVCDDTICRSSALQAALLTALNCGKRAFLGGVKVTIPDDVPLLIPWPDRTTLNDVVLDLIPDTKPARVSASHTIYFGFQPDTPIPHALTLRATGWRGSIEPAAEKSTFEDGGCPDFALGGIFAAGLAVHRGFLRAAGISIFACDESAGISLWAPGCDWRASSSDGPPLRALPESLWILGLGHLGQAFLWSLGMLPFQDPSECELMLQDFDIIERANLGSGLLCVAEDEHTLKTRVCTRWLEERGFRTRLCERAFDETTHRRVGEPSVALCGFDKPDPRRLLEGAGFLRVLECGLGGSINDFDLIHIHNFPGRSSAEKLWQESTSGQNSNDQKLVKAFSPPGEVCGALALEIAGKSVSTSFIGAMASAMVFGELLRAFQKGPKYEELYLSPRNMRDCDFVASTQKYTASDMARCGYVQADQLGRTGSLSPNP